ncbi:MAG TPA: protein-tyrosine phosphatase family protein [Acidimicrobiales bacterium]|nr:protein-tyrosine phosphatase family protein [Acidimicrobiales bacterium]
MADSGGRISPNDELTDDDRSALAWAASTENPVAVAIAIRLRSGADANASVSELTAMRRDWEAAGGPQPEPHVHRTLVRFADGTTVMGVRFLGDDPYVRADPPDFGLYLDERWAPPWPHEHFDWPDFGVPRDLAALRRTLTDLLDRARKGERVEVGCLGGHGRTGTALACLAVLTGTPASDALAWVRTNYCYKAVETDVQERLIATFHP